MPLSRAAAFFLVLLAAGASAQSAGRGAVVRGVVEDRATGETLPGATVLALGPDSLRTGVASDTDGRFELALTPGRYQLRVSFIGYVAAQRSLDVATVDIDLGRIAIRPDTTRLGTTVVEAMQTRVEVRGDTTAFNADAYALTPGASAGDLIRRLPGVADEDGTIRAGGEEVQRVLVDGKEFFGDDTNTALDVLPADAIEEVQVFDRASDQEELTGFDDGERQQTINLVTKPERRVSLFGDARLAAGTGSHFLADAKINRFDGDLRVTASLQSDNLDFQTGSAVRGGGGQRYFGAFGFEGISRDAFASVNVNDSWGDWAEVSATYRITGSDGSLDKSLLREYLASEAAGQRYQEASEAEGDQWAHSVSGRAELELSDRTELRVRPRVGWSGSSRDDLLAAQTQDAALLLSQTRTETARTSRDLNLGVETNLGHKFKTEGRTVSLELELRSGRDDDDRQQQVDRTVRAISENLEADQFGREIGDDERTWRVEAEVAYTEPIGDDLQVLASVGAEVSRRDADQLAFRLDEAGAYTVPDPEFTSDAGQRVVSQRAGVALQRQGERLTATLGLNVEREQLTFEQTGTRAFEVDRSLVAPQPFARVQLKVGTSGQATLRYSASTDAPNATQLRDVVDDSNPLRITGGNPDLRTAQTHRVSLGYRTSNATEGTSLSAFGNAQVSFDGIERATSFGGSAPRTVRGVTLAPGAQLRYPINLDGAVQVFGFMSYGRPFFDLGNLNVNLNGRFFRTPNLRDDVLITRESLGGSASASVSTTGSETLDLTGTYRLGGRVELAGDVPATLTQRLTATADWQPGSVVTRGRFTVGYDPDQARETVSTRLDLSLGWSFLADDRVKAVVTLSDVLGQRADFDRDVTDLYVEESQRLAPGRVVMFSLGYTLRQSGGEGRPPGPPGFPGVIIR